MTHRMIEHIANYMGALKIQTYETNRIGAGEEKCRELYDRTRTSLHSWH